MFAYDKTKKYILTEDMGDIENYVGCRIPMCMKRPMFEYDISDGSEEEIIDKLSKFLTFCCVFNNVWKALGADDCCIKPIAKGEFLHTALKNGKVLKQTTQILL